MARILRITTAIALCSVPFAAYADNLPGPANAGRIIMEPPAPPADRSHDEKAAVPGATSSSVKIPEGAEKIPFTLKSVDIQGATAFPPSELEQLYTAYMGKNLNLGVVWTIAGTIRDHYRNAGYFLSRAYIPKQSITEGHVVVRVIEGHIGKVELDDPLAENRVVSGLINYLVEKRPVTSQEVESFLLKLNDLPGMAFRGIMAPLKDDSSESAVKLVLVPEKKKPSISASLDNFGSRYLGPYEASLRYSGSIIPLHQTTISGMTSLPANELRTISASHLIPLTGELAFELAFSNVVAKPGLELRAFDIESQATSVSASLTYKVIRQRDQNLSAKLGLDGKNTNSDLLDTALTRDRVRALRGSLTYDAIDRWNGYNVATVTLSQGLKALGAREQGALNASRSQAKPDFVKAELLFSRMQYLSPNWTLIGSSAAQMASGPLYSSEEFGYGGPNFGRAYDTSELTGDHGVALSLEVRYTGLSAWKSVSPTPYAFYDFGTVWNEDLGQVKKDSGASAGFGLRFNTEFNLSGNIGIAFPLTQGAGTPIYGENSSSPRYLMQLNYTY